MVARLGGTDDGASNAMARFRANNDYEIVVGVLEHEMARRRAAKQAEAVDALLQVRRLLDPEEPTTLEVARLLLRVARS